MKAIIVDDEMHVRDGIKLLANWETLGITHIYEARDGEEAIALITEHKPSIIFTDMKMPNKDGISLLKWIQEEELTSKTIVISGYDDYKYMRKAITYGSFDYILKPIDPEILNETIEKAVVELQEEETKRKLLVAQNFTVEPISKNSEQSSIQEIEEFIRENFQKDIKLQEISDRFFLSREYISRKFKHVFGETISDYIVKIRMENAKILLQNPTIKIYEISTIIGYQDDKYFRKVFKKQVGITPSEYRSSHVN